MHNAHQGYFFTQLRSFQLQEVSSNLQPMFEYESSTGKSSTNRVESCEWTDTGIKLKIPDMNMEMDSHTYACSASIWQGNKPQTGIGKIEIKGIVGECFVFLNKWYNCINVKFLWLWLYD